MTTSLTHNFSQLERSGIGSTSSEEEVVDFLANGCGCTKCFNGPCSGGLTADIVTDYRLAITELDSSELNLAIVAQPHAEMNNGELLTNTRGSARPGICQLSICIQGNPYLPGNVTFPSQDKQDKAI